MSQEGPYQEEEIRKELRALEEEQKRLKERLSLLHSIGKLQLSWPTKEEWITPEVEEMVRTVAEKYMKEVHVQPVVEACSVYRYHIKFSVPTLQMRDNSLDKLRSRYGKPRKKRRGRPKGSGDWPAKELVNELVELWQTDRGEKPGQDESEFGEFVREIAEALDVKNEKGNVTWAGIVREVVKDHKHERLRKLPAEIKMYLNFREALAMAAGNKWDNWLEEQREMESAIMRGMAEAASDALEKNRLVEMIKKLPGAENYIITVERKDSKVKDIPPDKKSG